MKGLFSLYPHYKNHVSCRLSEEKCQLRNLNNFDSIIDLEGSAFLFLKRITGLMQIREIVRSISDELHIPEETIENDFNAVIVSLLKNVLIECSENPIDDTKLFSEIIAPSIRSTIHFDITHRCSETCIHCLADKDNTEAPFNEITSVFRQAAELGFAGFSFSGGEPTLHSRFWDIIESAHDHGFYFTLFTNGLHFNERDINRLAQYLPEKVRISLYSMRPHIHDQITCVNGSFEKTITAILRMKEAGIKVFINCPVMNCNYEGFREVADFCFEQGLERFFDPVIQPARDLRTFNELLRLPYHMAKDVTGFQQDADELIVNVKSGVPVCNVGADLSIDAKLNVYPCPGLRLPIGNLTKNSLAEILNDNEIIQQAGSLCLEQLPLCLECGVRDGCYRCHGHAFQEHGMLTACSSLDKRQAAIRKELMIERGSLKVH